MGGLFGLMGVEIQSDSLCISQCPFCGSNKFIFNDEDFVCYSCNITGNTVDFVALKNGISKTTAKVQLYDNTEVLKILNFTAKYYHKKYTSYFKTRGLSKATIQKFQLGYADGFLHSALLKAGFKEEDIINSGICRANGKDLFYKRAMFPIMNSDGEVIGFGGRKIGDFNAPKYLNSPESNVFSKREVLYGIQNINPELPVYIVEGYMDAISLQQADINAVAVLGTAVGLGHVALLKSLNVKDIILSLDGDEAGITNTIRAIKVLKPYFNIKILNKYGNSKDPDEFIKKYGSDKFLELPLISVQKFLISSGVNPVDIL